MKYSVVNKNFKNYLIKNILFCKAICDEDIFLLQQEDNEILKEYKKRLRKILKSLKEKRASFLNNLSKKINNNEDLKHSIESLIENFNIRIFKEEINQIEFDNKIKDLCDEIFILCIKIDIIWVLIDKNITIADIYETCFKNINYILEGKVGSKSIYIPVNPFELIKKINYYNSVKKVMQKYENKTILIKSGEKTTIRMKFNEIVIILYHDLLSEKTKEELKRVVIYNSKNEEEEAIEIINLINILLQDENIYLLKNKKGKSVFTPRIKRILDNHLENIIIESDTKYIKDKYKEILNIYRELDTKKKNVFKQETNEIFKKASSSLDGMEEKKLNDENIFNMIEVLYKLLYDKNGEINSENEEFLKQLYIKKIFDKPKKEPFKVQINRFYKSGKGGISKLKSNEIRRVKKSFNSIRLILAFNKMNDESRIALRESKQKRNYYDYYKAFKEIVKDDNFIKDPYVKNVLTDKFIELIKDISSREEMDEDNNGKTGDDIIENEVEKTLIDKTIKSFVEQEFLSGNNSDKDKEFTNWLINYIIDINFLEIKEEIEKIEDVWKYYKNIYEPKEKDIKNTEEKIKNKIISIFKNFRNKIEEAKETIAKEELIKIKRNIFKENIKYVFPEKLRYDMRDIEFISWMEKYIIEDNDYISIKKLKDQKIFIKTIYKEYKNIHDLDNENIINFLNLDENISENIETFLHNYSKEFNNWRRKK